MPGGSSIMGQMIQRGVTPAPAPASPRHPSADPGGGPAHPGRGRDDGIRPGDLLPVEAEHLPGGDLRPARLLRVQREASRQKLASRKIALTVPAVGTADRPRPAAVEADGGPFHCRDRLDSAIPLAVEILRRIETGCTTES
jgi:hypothetical protein